MADILYVDADYVELGYYQVGSTAAYIEPDYFQGDYVGAIVQAEALLTVASTVTALPLRIFQFDLAVTANATTDLNNIRLRPGVVDCSVEFTASAQPTVTFAGQSSAAVTAVLQNFGGRLPTAQAELTAFNTLVTAGARQGAGTVLMEVVAVVTALGGLLKSASVNNRSLLDNPTPYDGVYIAGNLDVKTTLVSLQYIRGFDTVQGVDDLQWGTDDVVISFYAQRFSSQGGTVISSQGRANNLESAVALRLTDSSISITQSVSAGPTSAFNFSINFPAIPNYEWHHYWIAVPGTQLNLQPEVYIDGVYQGDLTGTSNSLGQPGIDGLAIGLKRQLVSSAVNFSDPFYGVVSQMWIGPRQTTLPTRQALPTSFYQINSADNRSISFQDLGLDGRKSDTITQPFYYDTFDYTDNFSGNVNNGQLAPAPDYFNQVIGPTVSAGMNLTTDAVKLNFAAADLVATASLTATAVRAKPGQSAVNVSTEFAATATDFSQLDLNVSAFFNFIAVADKIKFAQADLSAEYTVESDTIQILSGFADLSGVFTVDAGATTNQLAESELTPEFTFVATATDFTKGIVNANVEATVFSNAQFQQRTRVDSAVSAEFSMSATAYDFTQAQAQINSAFETIATASRTRTSPQSNLPAEFAVTAQSLRRRVAVANLSAVAFAAAEGKFLDLIDENRIVVQAESGELLVLDLESTVLTVPEQLGLNTVLVNDGLERSVVSVDSATGVLLAQFNTPNT